MRVDGAECVLRLPSRVLSPLLACLVRALNQDVHYLTWKRFLTLELGSRAPSGEGSACNLRTLEVERVGRVSIDRSP